MEISNVNIQYLIPGHEPEVNEAAAEDIGGFRWEPPTQLAQAEWTPPVSWDGVLGPHSASEFPTQIDQPPARPPMDAEARAQAERMHRRFLQESTRSAGSGMRTKFDRMIHLMAASERSADEIRARGVTGRYRRNRTLYMTAGTGWSDYSASVVMDRAHLLHSVGRYHEALALFEGLLEIDPSDLYCRDAVSALYLAIREPEEAIRHASLVIEADPTHVWALSRRCEGHLRLGMIAEAERDLRRLQELKATRHALRMQMRLDTVSRARLDTHRRTKTFRLAEAIT